ncbi:hypothetical protein ACVIOG_004643 [Rhizobium leguminosarum]
MIAARDFFGPAVVFDLKPASRERRLLEAKRLLMFTLRSVEDIGSEIGCEVLL